MSQMKPYCFKCGAELDPEAIYCPECGRLQRSMVVRAVEPGAQKAPPAPLPGASREQPIQFYPNREAPPAPPADAQPDPASYNPGSTWQQPDQPDQHAQQYSDQGWQAGEQSPAGDEHGQAYAQDGWGEPAPHQEQAEGDHAYAQHEGSEPDPQWAAPSYNGYPQQDQQYDPYGQQPQGYDEHGQAYHEHGQAYGEQAPAYGEQAQGYGEQAPAYGEQEPAYGDQHGTHDETDQRYAGHEAGYEQAEQPYAGGYGEAAPPYGHQAPPYQESAHQEPSYQQPHDEPEAHDQPAPSWSRASSAATPEAAAPPPAAPPAPPPAAPWQPRTDPPRTPPEPIYSSSVPPAAVGSFRSRPAAAASSPYSPTVANPYQAPYRPETGGSQRGPSRVRIVALIGAALLGLFLVSFAIGQFIANRGTGNASSPSAVASQPPATTQPTTAPTTAPTTTTRPTPTPEQAIVGNAKFQRVSASIPGRCTTSQGCPIQVTLKNNGEQGSGSVTVTLTDAQGGGNTVGTFTGAIPVTDAGGTVQVSGFANGDQLPAYLRGGGTVYITSVDIRNGG
jgi:zinc-ribbon domain